MTWFGYIRTSRDRHAGQAGMDPETQQQVRAAGVSPVDVYRDIGLSGGTATATRNGWRGLDGKLQAGDTLVVAAVDRLGRRWVDVTSVLRDLQSRRVRVQSLADSEAPWVGHLLAKEGSAEELLGDLLASVLLWVADAERQATVRRTSGGVGPRPGGRQDVGSALVRVP